MPGWHTKGQATLMSQLAMFHLSCGAQGVQSGWETCSLDRYG